MVAGFGNVYLGAKVLVTGNTGFKGSWLSQWLLGLGANVVGVADEVPTSPSLYRLLNLEKKVTQYWLDIRNAEGVKDIISKEAPDFVFHLAARAITRHSFTDPLSSLSVNAMGTANVLDALRGIGQPCNVVLVTSDKCYENKEWPWGYRETDTLGGHDMYSASKACAELIAHAYTASFFNNSDRIKIVTARAGNVIGGGDWAEYRIVPDYVRAVEHKTPMQLRHPNSTRPWQLVLEPLSGYLRLGQMLASGEPLHGEAFNFGPNSQTDVTVATLLGALHNQILPDTDFGQLVLQGNAPDSREAGLLKLNCDKAQAMLQWVPVLGFEDTIRLTASWYKAYLAHNTGMEELTNEQIAMYTAQAQKLGLQWAL